MSKYIVHKAVNLDKVIKKNQRPLAELERTHMLQWKYDGCCVVIQVGIQALSRTGENVMSMGAIEYLLQSFKQLQGMVIIGEAWHPLMPFNEISGEFRRYAESDKLMFVIFDCLTAQEFAEGHSDVPYAARQERYSGVRVQDRIIPAFTAPPASYGPAEGAAAKIAKMAGYDGIILRDPMGTWTAGSGTTGEIIKIKPILSFDLKVVGWTGGEGKHEGRMGALAVEFEGKVLWVGTGFSDEERKLPLSHWHGQIIEVEALTYSSEGLLREPRFKGIRFDKGKPDE